MEQSWSVLESLWGHLGDILELFCRHAGVSHTPQWPMAAFRASSRAQLFQPWRLGVCEFELAFSFGNGVFSFQSTQLLVVKSGGIKACGEKLSKHWKPCVCVLELIDVIRMRVCPRALAQGDSCDELGIVSFAKMMYSYYGIAQCNC